MGAVDGGDTCPECAGQLKSEGTEVCCEECGLVVAEDALDRGPEWRWSEDGPDRRRTGAPLTRSRHDRGLSTKIGYAQQGRITGRKRRQLARMRREHDRARIATKTERNRVCGFSKIWGIVARLSLPLDAREQACCLFESAQKEGLLPGRSIDGFAAACVYAVSRTLDVPRTIDEVVAQASATEAELKVAYDAMNRELGLPTGPIEPATYLPRFASELDLSTDEERLAREFVDLLADHDAIGGRNPGGVAAACLYEAAKRTNRPITQEDAGDVADVWPVTIRKTVQTIRELRDDGS